ncbi:MAG: hypothetical protein GX116_01170 [Fibrobacter sp.]|jgi:hypothetical protein|nr:hypothetical protein [Fibrobacter sp.]
MQKKRVQTVQWFEKMTVSFQLQWKLCRWHKGGDRKLSPLKQSLKKYASHLQNLPENLLSVLCEHTMINILRISPSYHLWTAAFDKQDQQKEEKKNSPEQKIMIDSMNAAMNDLLPFVNSDMNPDWSALAKKHGLDEGGIESIKSIYESVKNQRN